MCRVNEYPTKASGYRLGARFQRRRSNLQRRLYGHQTGTREPDFSGKEKGLADANLLTLIFTGRDGGIRTHDPLHPMQVRYLAALRPDWNKL